MAEIGLEEVVCWHCRQPVEETHFCPACGKIQPVGGKADYFAALGLPPRLRLDADDLERRFLSLSWKLHPDNFVQADEYERTLALERSALLNDAYRTLRDPIARIEYLLERHGLRREGTGSQQVPGELLEEVFELNESLEELQAAREHSGAEPLEEVVGRLRQAEASFTRKLAELDRQLDELAGQWDRLEPAQQTDAAGRTILAQMNEILHRRSYMRNLVQRVRDALAEA